MNELICIMTGQQYRAAFEIAGKKDPRSYINGIHIRPADGHHGVVESTNGHMAFRSPINYVALNGEADRDIIFEAVKIPVSAHRVEIHDLGPDRVLLETYTKKDIRKDFYAAKIPGKFPLIDSVIPRQREKVDAMPIFAFNSNYLALVARVFDGGNVQFNMRDAHSVARITATGGDTGRKVKELPEESILVLMPLKV
jgi:hypothetical protein